MAYKAIVARIHTRPLPGSDFLTLGSVSGYQVLVNKDTENGSLMALFEGGGQLSEGFAKQHDLVRRKDENGNNAGGFFEENRRVKALKMRGSKSEGFAVPLSHFDYTGVDPSILVEGYQFDELNGVPICNKYFTPQTLRAQRQGQGSGSTKRENEMFAKHVDTEQFKRGLNMIPEGSLIYISEKVHGTSFRYGRVREEMPLALGKVKNAIAKFMNRFFTVPTNDSVEYVWQYLNGSRNVILSDGKPGYHGTEDFRRNAIKGIALHKGEVIYGELVGYTETGAPIMSTQDTGALKDKAIEKRFGKTVTYSYGQEEGTTGLYVYRITQVNEDGHVTELSWNQVVKRCNELGIKTVPVLETTILDAPVDFLVHTVQRHTEGENGEPLASVLDYSHPREGVVVRYESQHGTDWLKNKSFAFGLLEGYLKEKDDYVDAEEIA